METIESRFELVKVRVVWKAFETQFADRHRFLGPLKLIQRPRMECKVLRSYGCNFGKRLCRLFPFLLLRQTARHEALGVRMKSRGASKLKFGQPKRKIDFPLSQRFG